MKVRGKFPAKISPTGSLKRLKKRIALPGRPRLTANILANFQGLEGRHEKWTARIFTQEVLNTDALLSWKEREREREREKEFVEE